MDGNTKIAELTIDEYKNLYNDIVNDDSMNHFLKAVDKLFDEKANQVVKDFTGKDISQNNDVLCIRKTYDSCQECRLKKEKVKDTLLTEGVKKISHWVMMVFALGFAAWAKFGE